MTNKEKTNEKKMMRTISIEMNDKEAYERVCPEVLSSDQDFWDEAHAKRFFEVVSEKQKGKMLTIVLRETSLQERKKEVSKLAKELAPSLDRQAVIEDVLGEYTISALRDLSGRVFKKKKAKVTQKKGCVKLLVGGKPGAPHTIQIR